MNTYNITANAITTQEEVDTLCEYLNYQVQVKNDAGEMVDNPQSKVEFFQEYWNKEVKGLFIRAYRLVEEKKNLDAQLAADAAMQAKLEQVKQIADQTISVNVIPQ